MRVLLIASETQSHAAFRESAWRANVTLDTASGPVEAAELAGTWDYDVVFVDMDGSAHDGVSLTHAVRWRFPVARVVMVDEWLDASHRIRVLDAGADEVLDGPLDADELTARLRGMNRGRSSEDRPPPPIRSELVAARWTAPRARGRGRGARARTGAGGPSRGPRARTRTLAPSG